MNDGNSFMLYANDVQLDDELRGGFKNSFKERSSVVVNLFGFSISNFIPLFFRQNTNILSLATAAANGWKLMKYNFNQLQDGARLVWSTALIIGSSKTT